ncbi:MAG: DUF3365 domain-containing protein [Planctomycetaceae bacterium]|nr:DUF3365 domain-containing protein [Planctomycetaceae bacterium]
MIRPHHWRPWITLLVLSLLSCVIVVGAEPASTPSTATPSSAAPPNVDPQQRVALDVARDRAKLMHEIYVATMDVMHERYFHGERAFVPARAMEDVFAQMNRQSQVEARWISVNVRAMSVNHEPKTPFEKRAAEEIAAGKESIDEIEGGFYRRAGAIPLADGCVNCHGGFFRESSKTPKFAGLVISVPVKAAKASH